MGHWEYNLKKEKCLSCQHYSGCNGVSHHFLLGDRIDYELNGMCYKDGSNRPKVTKATRWCSKWKRNYMIASTISKEEIQKNKSNQRTIVRTINPFAKAEQEIAKTKQEIEKFGQEIDRLESERCALLEEAYTLEQKLLDSQLSTEEEKRIHERAKRINEEAKRIKEEETRLAEEGQAILDKLKRQKANLELNKKTIKAIAIPIAVFILIFIIAIIGCSISD